MNQGRRLALRCVRAHPRLEAPEHVHPRRAPIEQPVPPRIEVRRLQRHHGRHPHRWLSERIDAVEIRWRDPDYRHRVVVDEHFAPDHVRCSTETVLPVSVREHDDGMSAGLEIVGRLDEAAQLGAGAEHLKVRAGNDLGANAFVLLPGREIHARRTAAEDAVEDPILLLQVTAQGIRHQVAAAPRTRHGLAPPVQVNEALGFFHRQ